jgi:hypothetical protein
MVSAETFRAIASDVSAETSGPFVESVDALSADEALLLARELPHLRGLINGDLPGIDRDTARGPRRQLGRPVGAAGP